MCFCAGSIAAEAQTVPDPTSEFGFTLGTDRRLANWTQIVSYLDQVAQSSRRVRIDTLGTSTGGQPFVMLTITSPANHRRLDELRAIQQKLADPRSITSVAERNRLLAEGRAVVLITHGIHSTEVGSTQMSARLAHRLAASDDPVVARILDEVIVVQIPSLNPDGAEWVADWYNSLVGTRMEAAPLPWLYHFYTGHDNNRDWYAFTQKETRLAVEFAHNAWRPQVVHDVHQMGGSGARIFFPPYIDPWEPNVDPALTSAVTRLGSSVAAEMTAEGRPGVVTQAIYDAWSPARAYSHYHAGARILSETASAALATPVEVDAASIGGGRGYDAAVRSWNHPWPWTGGRWGLPEIVDYMEAGAMALLDQVARDRRYWLENFLSIGERSVEGWESWPEAWVIPATPENQANTTGLSYLLRVMTTADVEVRRTTSPMTRSGRRIPAGSWVIPMKQPYAGFAQALLERQVYPDLREYPGGPPQRPYDVTAHTLPLLLGVDVFQAERTMPGGLTEPIAIPELTFPDPEEWFDLSAPGDSVPAVPRIAYYKSHQEPMEGGWTRWVFDEMGLPYDTLSDAAIRDAGRGDGLGANYDVLLLQAQSPRSIRSGFAPGTLPATWTGGLGAAGERAIRDFVRNGGRLVAIEESTDFAIDLFGLRVANLVERLPPGDFYVPGSILSLRLEDTPWAEGLDREGVAWFWGSSRAFEVTDPSIRVLARYGDGNPLLSGWILGPEFLAGRPALVEASVGRGSVVLFGYQPNYRGQSVATWGHLMRAMDPARSTVR